MLATMNSSSRILISDGHTGYAYADVKFVQETTVEIYCLLLEVSAHIVVGLIQWLDFHHLSLYPPIWMSISMSRFGLTTHRIERFYPCIAQKTMLISFSSSTRYQITLSQGMNAEDSLNAFVRQRLIYSGHILSAESRLLGCYSVIDQSFEVCESIKTSSKKRAIYLGAPFGVALERIISSRDLYSHQSFELFQPEVRVSMG